MPASASTRQRGRRPHETLHRPDAMTASPATLERARHALEAAPKEASEQLAYFFSHPVLLRSDLGEELERDVDEGVLTGLRRLRNTLAVDPSCYDIGGGPVEQLWQRVDNGELAIEQACKLATHAAFGEVLTPLYVSALADVVLDLIGSGDWRQALSDQHIVLAGLDACIEATIEARTVAVHALLCAAQAALAAVPDRAVAEDATTRGRGLVDELLAAGRRTEAAQTFFTIGAMWLDAYCAEADESDYEEADRRRDERARREHTHGLLSDDPATWRMQPRIVGIRLAEAYLRAALQTADAGPECPARLLEAMAWRRLLGEEVDQAEMVRVGRQAFAGLDVEAYPASSLHVWELLTGLGEDVGPAPVDAVLALSTDEIARRHGRQTAIRILLRIAGILRLSDPWRCLDSLVRARRLLSPGEDAKLRRDLLDLELEGLLAGPGRRATSQAPASSLAGRVAELRGELDEPGVDPYQIAAELVCLARLSPNWGEARAGVAALDAAVAISPVLVVDHGDLVSYVRARLEGSRAEDARRAGDHGAALEHYASAMRCLSALWLDDDVIECLGALKAMALSAGSQATLALAVRLAELAPSLERQFRRRAMELVGDVVGRLIVAGVRGTVATGSVGDLDVLIRLLQIAKGQRFGAALAGGLRPLPLSEEQTALLSDIAAAGAVQLASPLDDVTAERMLVSPYAGEQLPGRTRAERVVNLQRRFDELHEASLVTRMLRPAPSIRTAEEICRSLDPNTVLALCYGPRGGSPASGAITVLFSDNEVQRA
jgi:hypothetical protein